MRVCLYIAILFLSLSTLEAQINPEAGPVFEDQDVPRIDIILEQADLDWILDDNNLESNTLFQATFIFESETILDTVTNIGFRLRGNTSRNADKKSFKIDFNEFDPGRKFYGLEKMNLNGQHNDPLISRAKVCSDLGIALDIPMMRTNHVRLYINGEFRGVYLNVEHIDEEFMGSRFGNETGNLYKCLYPADLDFKGSNPELYKEEFWGRRAYDQKNNKEIEDYSDLAAFIDILNNSESVDFACELEEIFNVDRYLYSIIFDILTGNWDGPIYNKNNFYLYFDDKTNRFEYVAFDLDNTLGIDWINRDWGTRNIYSWKKTNEARPLYSKIMENQIFRERFSYYMDKVLEDIYTEDLLFPYFDEMRDKIYPFVEIDPYYSLDYDFQLNHFYDGFDYADLPFNQTDYSLKDFIETRRENALEQLESYNVSPIIIDVKSNNPNLNEELIISANITDDIAIMNAQLCYIFNDQAEICIPIVDDGNNQDGETNDNVYGLVLAPFQEAGTLSYRITASDINSNLSSFPFCDYTNVYIDELDIKLAINEIAPANTFGYKDEYGEEDDWIELYNYGDYPISLKDKYLSDKADEPFLWQLPNVVIAPYSFALIWADKDNEQGKWHTNFKLSSGGESLYLNDETAEAYLTINETTYESIPAPFTWSRLPDGFGNFDYNFATPESYNEYLSTDEEQASDFIISPNPVSSSLAVTSIDEISDLSFKIYNLQSVLLLEGKIDKNERAISLPDWPSGLYYISLKTSRTHPKTKMFVKM